MKEKIKDFLWGNIGWYINWIYRRFYNLYRWLPIIWKDRDYDAWYIYTILQTKLKHQAEYIARHDRHTMAQKDAQRMMTCVRLIEKIKEESYNLECMEYHETKTTIIPNDRGTYSVDFKIVNDQFQEYFLAYPLDYRRVLKGEGWLNINEEGIDQTERDYRIASNMSHNRQHRAKKLLFRILDQDIEGWWD